MDTIVLEALKASRINGVKLKVWWIPQIPMKTFEVEVETVNEGLKICDILAKYDAFQFENVVRPDYCNVGGLSFSHPQIEDGWWLDVPEDDEELVHWFEEIKDARKRLQADQQESV